MTATGGQSGPCQLGWLLIWTGLHIQIYLCVSEHVNGSKDSRLNSLQSGPCHCDWKAHGLRNHRPADWRRWITSERLKSHFTVQGLWQSSRPPTATRKVTCVKDWAQLDFSHRVIVFIFVCKKWNIFLFWAIRDSGQITYSGHLFV